MQPSDANGTATHRSAPSILQTFHVAIILSLSVGFADLAVATMIIPSRFISFSSLLPPLCAGVLTMLIGYMVIWGVSHSLHTPLMSVTNAISSIIVIGALIQVSTDNTTGMLLAGLAIFITAINIVGGFAVTQRMLRMFRK